MHIPAIPGYTRDRLRALTTSARRYGWHATIKAPFRLAPGRSEGDLQAALAAFCGTCQPFELPVLSVATLGDFVALLPSLRSEPLQQCAFACVLALDACRAPLSAMELARRRAGSLTPGEEAALLRHGYPYVGADFQFHLTLTDALDEADRMRLMPALATLFEPALREPLILGELALYGEPTAGAPFRLLSRFAFGAGPEAARGHL